MENKLPERKPTRLKYHDYGKPGAYFVTICTEDRAEILSTICGKTVVGPDALGVPPCKNATASVGDDALGVPTIAC